MFIDTMKSFHRLLQWIDAPHLQLTLDVGHLWCQGELPIADYIARWGQRIVNVHIEDMRAGVHEHLMFGEGEMRLPADPRSPGQSRLSRRPARRAQPPQPRSARPRRKKAFDFLRPLVEKAALP